MQITKHSLFLIINFRKNCYMKRWFNLSDKIRFLFVGCFNASVSYLIYSSICIVIGSSSYQIALAIAWLISSIVSFSTQKFLVFQGKGFWFKEYLKCCTTWFFSYLINATLLELFVKIFGINVYVSQILATFFCAIFNYILFKKYAFKKIS